MSLYDIGGAIDKAYHDVKNIDEKLTFESFRKSASKARAELLDAQSVRNKNNEFALATFADSLANEKINAENAKYAEIKNSKLKTLKANLAEIADAKRNQLTNYFTSAPTTEQINLLQALKMQDESITETELSMLIDKCIDNYRALTSLKSIVKASGFDFALPVDANNALADLDAVVQRCEFMLSSIDVDDTLMGYYQAEFYADTKQGYFGSKFLELDSAKTFAIPKEEIKVSTLDLLNANIEKSAENADYAKYIKLRTLKDELGDSIKTPEEKDKEVRMQIKDIMNNEHIELDEPIAESEE